MAWNVVQASVLFAAAILAVWVGISAFQRQSVPGRSWLGGMQMSIAFWAATSALHALLVSMPQRIVVSQLQYIGIMALPVCWLEFAHDYTRRPVRTAPWLIWLIPAVTVALAFSNGAHHLVWTEIREIPADGYTRLQYVHGPWFFISTGFTYLALAAGTIWMAGAIRHQPREYRLQSTLIVSALAAPWISNMFYLAGLLPAGFDPTPIGFTVSGVMFSLGLYRYHLFDLVPIARTVLFDSLGDAAFVIDREGRVVDGNAAARTLAGGDLPLGTPIERVLRWWRGRSPMGDASHIVHADGRAFDVQLRPVLDDDKALSAWLVLIRDVTARERADLQQRQLDHRLMQQQQVESLALLAGGLSHDFKSLLTGIIGNADLAASLTTAGTPARESIDAILTAADRASDLVQRMQVYSGHAPNLTERVDLAAIADDMTGLLRSSVARPFRLRCEIPALPVWVRGDATQMRQVVMNLVSNAAEASAGQTGAPITVRVSATPAANAELDTASFDGTGDIRATQIDYAVLDVIDEGAGMDARTAARVFDPFFSTKAQGRGLGLSAALGIIRRHNGAVRVRSAVGQGTSVRVWLPLVSE